MKKRFKMNRRKSKRNFTQHAVKTNRINTMAKPMRGGIRL